MLKGVDYASGRPNLATVKAVGYGFIVRYLCPATEMGGLKLLSASEVADAHLLGLGVVTCFEDGAQNALGGVAQGAIDATLAISQLRMLGAPAGAVVFFAVDFDATTAQMPVIIDYFASVRAKMHAAGFRVGVYGCYAVLDECFAHGVVDLGWQSLAWSNGQVHPKACLYQCSVSDTVAGASVDIDEALAADYGQWQKPSLVSTILRRPAPPRPVEPTTARTAEGVSNGTQTYRGIAAEWGVPVSSLWAANPGGPHVQIDDTHYDTVAQKGVFVWTYAERTPPAVPVAPVTAPAGGPVPAPVVVPVPPSVQQEVVSGLETAVKDIEPGVLAAVEAGAPAPVGAALKALQALTGSSTVKVGGSAALGGALVVLVETLIQAHII